ncbi:exodeoxyribonuclease VII large subunit [Prevotella sp. AGR2160]|uniref:exodeoxyribonuclease VII large subunit n=1 Tax=Prevotella sp. AGR2160 TaxID=1280674 RepID=UPI000413ADD1|nr:exodeoxyribonuclease VII large subunit [Prevotella sp. AGR2160]
MKGKPLTLLELNHLVRRTLELSMPGSYWVEAELSEARERGGHCYMDLIQKDEQSNTPVAHAAAKCWRSTWGFVKSHFERVTGQTVHAGMKVLLQVHAQFHENYGFSWIVDDIDPTYTLGDMARKRQEILRQLEKEGVIDLQKDLRLSPFAQHIAVISSDQAAGYGDFCNQLSSNDYGFTFSVTLFPAVMQGEGVEKSIIAALNAINADLDAFDAVVIIRGGGATSDLSGFDTLALAENVANFPLPVITGIGHERDESVLDRVSFQRVKTPTAAAAFLIDNLARTWTFLANCQEQMVRLVQRRMEEERGRLNVLAGKIPVLFSLVRAKEGNRLERLMGRLTMAMEDKLSRSRHQVELLDSRIPMLLSQTLMRRRHQLEMLGQRLQAQDPRSLLKRGYSLTMKDGKAVKDVALLQKGDRLTTIFERGKAVSIVAEKD